jgi:transposase IS200 family protein
MRKSCGTCARTSGAELRELDGEPQHAHLLVNIPPTIAISHLVNSLKGVSSHRLRQEFPDVRRHYWQAKRLWSGSYPRRFRGARPSLPCASTSSSRTVPPDQLMSTRLHHRQEGQRTGGQLGSGGRSADRDREVAVGLAALGDRADREERHPDAQRAGLGTVLADPGVQ